MRSQESTRGNIFLLARLLVAWATAAGCCGTVRAADWAGWRGPNRQGKCLETGLLKAWPEGGPKLLWEMSGLGTGYSSLAVVGGKFYTMGDIQLKEPGQDRSGKVQCVIACDLATRKQLWAAEVGPPHDDGPRCTPTVDADRAYAIGTSGDVVCVALADGKVIWTKNLQKDLEGGSNPGWRFSESPLIDGDRLLCTPGGHKAVIAALDKKSGGVIWKCSMPDIGDRGSNEAGYSSIVITDVGGIKQYVQLTNEGMVGVAAKDGRFLWGYNKIANGTANIPTAVVFEDYVFCSTAYGTGSALLRLVPEGDAIRAEEVYFLDSGTFQNHHGGFVMVGDYIYGGHGHNSGAPTCVEAKTGKIMWRAEQPGGGSAAVLYADGHLYFRYQDDAVALIEATPEEYNLKGKFKLPRRDGMSGPGWSHPVISDGRLYLRHADVLLVYDISAK